jgi:protease IV
MSTNYGQFTLSHGGNGPRTGPAVAAVLWSVGLALMLAATRAPAAPSEQTAKAAPGEQAVEEKSRNVVAVFRLDGPVTEVPADDLQQMFGPPGASLKDLVTRLSKAAADPAVKAVVIVPETGWLGSAQIEELRAAMAVVRKQDKEVFVHADSLVLGQYLLACGASRISVVPTGMLLIPGLHASSLHVRGGCWTRSALSRTS